MIIENIDKEITLCYTSKIDDNSGNFFLDVDLKYIQFHFCIDGNASFSYNNDSYKLNLDSNKFLTLYDPSKNIPINCKISPKTKLVSLLISINKFHSLFSDSASSISFISDDNLNKKYYKEDSIPNKTLTVLNQILNENLNKNIKKI